MQLGCLGMAQKLRYRAWLKSMRDHQSEIYALEKFINLLCQSNELHIDWTELCICAIINKMMRSSIFKVQINVQ